MTTEPRPDVVVSARIQSRTETAIAIEYLVRNRSSQIVYVFDRHITFDRSKVLVDPRGAFVLLAGEGVVRVVRAVLAAPPLMNVYVPPPSFVSIVADGAEHRGTIELPVPLVERHLYYGIHTPTESDRPELVDRVRLQVGWIEHRPGMQIVDGKAETGPEKQLMGAWGRPLQRLSEVELPAGGLQVIPHPPPFVRTGVVQ